MAVITSSILTVKTFSCTWFCLPLLFIRVNWVAKLCWGTTRVSWAFSAPIFLAEHVFVCLCLDLCLLLGKMRLVLKLIKLCTILPMLQAHAYSFLPILVLLSSLFFASPPLDFTLFCELFIPLSFLSPPSPFISPLFTQLPNHVLQYLVVCTVFLKLESHAASYPNISMWQASAFSCQSKLQASTHRSVIGADEKKTITSILVWAFGNSSAAPSIPPPSAWQSRNNTNRCDFQNAKWR